MTNHRTAVWNETYATQGFLNRLIRYYRRLPVKPFRSSLQALYGKYQLLYLGKQVIAEIDGIKYELDLDELIDRSIFFDGAFEPATAKVLKQLTPRGAIVLDIGANIGCHTCLLARLAYPGRVIAFEPMPWPRQKLLRNIALNELRNVTVEGFALTDREVEAVPVHFRSSWQLDSRTGISRENCASCGPAIVDFSTLDDYVAENNVESIGLIKLDVDGYEAKVLRGAQMTLEAHRPILVMEFCHYSLEAVGDRLSDLIGFLNAAGYRIFQEDMLVEFPTKESILGSVPTDASINVVCCRERVSR